MNIQNIEELMGTLRMLGFSSASGRGLLRHACLRQSYFWIRERHVHENDVICYQVFFKKEKSTDKLICSHYDATLRKEIKIEKAIVNGIDVQDLDERMTMINWLPDNPGASASETFSITDKSTWKQEAAIEEVIQDMEALSITNEGCIIADTLKYKHWIELPLQNMIPQLMMMRSRFESAQRFHIINGEGITAGEAYRFLNNRWRDKQMQVNKRMERQSESNRRQDKPEAKTGRDKKKRVNIKS